jgi:N-acetyl-anhydromuramyl-L-alanine amidase AmpD
MIIRPGLINENIITINNIIDKLPRNKNRPWETMPSKPDRIILHCNASTNQDPFKTNDYDTKPNKVSSKGCESITYHDFIDNKGTVYRCNHYNKWIYHCGLWNKKSIGVVIGFTGEGLPETKQYETTLLHLTNLCILNKISPNNIYGHREIPYMYTILSNGYKAYKKACPGYQIDMFFVRQVVSALIQKIMKQQGLYNSTIDGIFGKLSEKAFSMISSNNKYLIRTTEPLGL